MLTPLLFSLLTLGGTLLLGLALLPALLLQRVMGRPTTDELEEEVGDPWAPPLVASPFLESLG